MSAIINTLGAVIPRATHRLSLFKFSLKRQPFGIKVHRTPIADLMNTALCNVILCLV